MEHTTHMYSLHRIILTVNEFISPYSACDVSELVDDLICGRDLVSGAHNDTPNLKQIKKFKLRENC